MPHLLRPGGVTSFITPIAFRMDFLPAHTTKRHFQLNQPKAGSIGNESEDLSRWRRYPTSCDLRRSEYDLEGLLRPAGVTTTTRPKKSQTTE